MGQKGLLVLGTARRNDLDCTPLCAAAEELYGAVRPEDEIVVYCSNMDCLSSVALYRDLVRRGYRSVRRYSGGLLDWEDAGLPLEGEFVAVR